MFKINRKLFSLDERIEQKVILSHGDCLELNDHLIKEGYSEIFCLRRINSIYYDNHSLDFYTSVKEGLPRRSKVRVRWYAESKQNKKLEIKNNTNGIKSKYAAKLENHSDNELFFDSAYGVLFPVAKTQYLRRYYINDAGVRITVDTDFISNKINYSNSHLFTSSTKRYLGLIVEIKCSPVLLDYVNNFIPFTRSHFSKYEFAMD
jgi:hypothetical protein